MAVLKIACPRCGQRVSGDESFYGNSVDCPVCSSKIVFPDKPIGPKGATDSASDPIDETPRADDYGLREMPDDLPKRESTPIPLKADTPKRKKAPKPPAAGFNDEEDDEYADHDDDGHFHYDDVPPSPLLGILSMVFGILNVVTFCIPSLILAPISIICGHLALSRAQFSPVQPAPGKGMAIAGLIMGYLGMIALLITLVLVAVGVVPNPLVKTEIPLTPQP